MNDKAERRIPLIAGANLWARGGPSKGVMDWSVVKSALINRVCTLLELYVRPAELINSNTIRLSFVRRRINLPFRYINLAGW